MKTAVFWNAFWAGWCALGALANGMIFLFGLGDLGALTVTAICVFFGCVYYQRGVRGLAKFELRKESDMKSG